MKRRGTTRPGLLINPYKTQVQTIPGTRILSNGLGVVGFQYRDPITPNRTWVVQQLLAPIKGRHLGGIRAKLCDEKSFVTFVNQRDLEVIVGIAKPGDYCYWMEEYYPGVGDDDWYGLCLDDEDLLDDLHERELRLREQYPGILPSFIEIYRRIHSDGADAEELFTLIADADIETGYGPDYRLETVSNRWSRIERTSVKWAYL